MVVEHAGPAQRLAEGLRSLPSGKTALAATMAAYRFLNGAGGRGRALRADGFGRA